MQQMKNNIEKDLKKYYHDIAKVLPLNRKKEFLINIKNGVNSYLADNPNATIDDVIAFIGEPEDIADEYYANKTGEEIVKGIKISKKIVFSVIVTLVLGLIIYIIVMTKMMIDDDKADHGYYTTDLGITESEQISSTDL